MTTSSGKTTLKRNILWGMSTLSAAVLTFGLDAGMGLRAATDATATSGTSAGSGTSGSGTSGSGTSGTDSGTTSGAAQGSGSAGDSSGTTTYTGDAAQTRYGPVQVQITVVDGKVTTATAIAYPKSDPHDAMINDQAVPLLEQEAIQAQSSAIDSVSGATFTSHGYIASLQSALDQANL